MFDSFLLDNNEKNLRKLGILTEAKIKFDNMRAILGD